MPRGTIASLKPADRERLSALESSVQHVAETFDKFVEDSRDHREKSNADVNKLWEALTSQNDAFQKALKQQNTDFYSALEKQGAHLTKLTNDQSTRLEMAIAKVAEGSQISWKGIGSLVLFVLTLVGTMASLGHAHLGVLMEKQDIRNAQFERLFERITDRSDSQLEKMHDLEVKVAFSEGRRSVNKTDRDNRDNE